MLINKAKYIFLLFLPAILCASVTLAESDFVYNSKAKRNPFIPLVGSDGRLIKLDKGESNRTSDLWIDGIIYDKHGVSYAIVNSKVVGVGDYSVAYQVLKVEDNKVIFIKDGKTREEKINQEGDK
ncbi:MAG: hypothetical protein NTW13_00935 [Candidatus Omnitrophica bacterium]|nr:hypothetical protein [Candidatus Omnitrophota bacterium]